MATEKATNAQRPVPPRKTRSTRNPTPERQSGTDAPAAARKKPAVSAEKIAGLASQQLVKMTGREAEAVTGLERTAEGWRVEVEVLEIKRVPDTTDVLAIYEVEVDRRGRLVGFTRARRYVRSSQDGEGR